MVRTQILKSAEFIAFGLADSLGFVPSGGAFIGPRLQYRRCRTAALEFTVEIRLTILQTFGTVMLCLGIYVASKTAAKHRIVIRAARRLVRIVLVAFARLVGAVRLLVRSTRAIFRIFP
jgi:hypothetical protein